jgi:RES domain
MLLYRIFPYFETAASGTPGHPDYVHLPAQGYGRIDNPTRYFAWYLAREAAAAVGEVFGNLDVWDDGMFDFPAIPGAKRALGFYRVSDGARLLNLDSGLTLHERGLRPTSVVEQNRAATQAWALRVFEERNTSGHRQWEGVEWWSFHRPHWRCIGLWGITPEAVDVEELGLSHSAVIDAASSLKRVI